MPDPEDIVDIDGLRPRRPLAAGPRRRFLAIWFRCCHTYGRLYRNDAGTAYVGRCPRCGTQVHALIGPGGTSRRMFQTE